jgi:predicted alpha/beta hydrolase
VQQFDDKWCKTKAVQQFDNKGCKKAVQRYDNREIKTKAVQQFDDKWCKTKAVQQVATVCRQIKRNVILSRKQHLMPF